MLKTLNVTQITLQNARSSASQNYSLNSVSISSQNNSVTVEIYLANVDVNAINQLRHLATDEHNTYLSATELTIEDMK